MKAVLNNRGRLARIAASLMLLSACSQSSPDQLNAIFNDFTHAIDVGQGYEAAKVASEETVAHYALLRDLALKGGRGMNTLGIYDEVSVYYLRGMFDVVALQKLSGRDVMNILVKAQLVGLADIEDYNLANISLQENQAVASLYKDGLDSNFDVQFRREKGRWKVDTQIMRRQREEQIVQRMIQYGGDREEVVHELLMAHGVREGLTANLMNAPG